MASDPKISSHWDVSHKLLGWQTFLMSSVDIKDGVKRAYSLEEAMKQVSNSSIEETIQKDTETSITNFESAHELSLVLASTPISKDVTDIEKTCDALKVLMLKTSLSISKSVLMKDQQNLIDLYVLRCRIGLAIHRLYPRETTYLTCALCDMNCARKMDKRDKMPDEINDLFQEIWEATKNHKKKMTPITWDEPDEGYSSTGHTTPTSETIEQLQVCNSKIKGRYIRLQTTSQSLKKEEEIFSEDPLVYVLKVGYSYSRCFNCLHDLNDKMFKCPRLCPVVFCSYRCYSNSKALHEKECRLLPFLFWGRSDVHLTFRSIIQDALIADGKTKPLLQTLTQRFLDYGISSKFSSCIKTLYVQYLLEKVDIEVSSGIILENLCKISLNSIALWTPKKTIGSAVYKNFSLLCHSCNPNSCAKYHGKTIHVSCSRNIRPGEEITFSYGPRIKFQNWSSIYGQPLLQRRQKLRYSYMFNCYCDACFLETFESDDSSLYQFQEVCQSCLKFGQIKTSLEKLSSDSRPNCLKKHSENGFESCILPNIPHFRSFLQVHVGDIDKVQEFTSVYEEIVKKFKLPNVLSLCFEDGLAFTFSQSLKRKENNEEETNMEKSVKFAEKAFKSALTLLGHHKITSLTLVRLLFLDELMNQTADSSVTDKKISAVVNHFCIRQIGIDRRDVDMALNDLGIKNCHSLASIGLWLQNQQPICLSSKSTTSFGCKKGSEEGTRHFSYYFPTLMTIERNCVQE